MYQNQTPNVRTNDSPSTSSTGILGALHQELKLICEYIYLYFLIISHILILTCTYSVYMGTIVYTLT